MRLNASTALVSPTVLLVPYEAHHVRAYHQWMDDEEIREATASERLTLDEEYEMQQSWREDTDKLTFIACLPPAPDSNSAEVKAGDADAEDRMIGDVNLFLSEEIEDEDGNLVEQPAGAPRRYVGEVELMIANKHHQGKGHGRAVLQLFLSWIVARSSDVVREKFLQELFPDGQEPRGELTKLRVKIHQTNLRSLALFESLGFKRLKEEANYFGEVEMEVNVDELEVMGEGTWKEMRYVKS